MSCEKCQRPMVLDRTFLTLAESCGSERVRYECRYCGRDAYWPPAEPMRDFTRCLAHNKVKPCEICGPMFRSSRDETLPHLQRERVCRECQAPFVPNKNAQRFYCCRACGTRANNRRAHRRKREKVAWPRWPK